MQAQQDNEKTTGGGDRICSRNHTHAEADPRRELNQDGTELVAQALRRRPEFVPPRALRLGRELRVVRERLGHFECELKARRRALGPPEHGLGARHSVKGRVDLEQIRYVKIFKSMR